MLRAAEVTLAAGYSHFLFDTRDTKAQTRYDAFPDYRPPDPFWGFGGLAFPSALGL